MTFSAPSPGSDQQRASRALDIRQKLGAVLRIVEELECEPEPLAAPLITEAYVRAMLKLRRGRDRFFEAELFADPAWDILLELYAAELGQRRMSVSSLCLGAAVPATTALRWIKVLETRGMIRRAADPMDGRRIFMFLSREASIAIERFFRSVPAGAVVS